MHNNQKPNDDDGGKRPIDRGSPPPSPVGKSALTAPTSGLQPDGPGPSKQPGVGKSALTANLVPAPAPAPLPSPAALQDPGQRAQVITTTSQQLDDTQTQLAQTRQQILVRRASGASTSSASSTASTDPGASTESLADLEGRVQILTAQVVQLRRETPRLVTIARPAPANQGPPANQEPAVREERRPERAPSPDPSEPPSEALSVHASEPDSEAPGFDYDWLKRAAKATSYGLQLAGAAVSMLGWAAWAHVPRVQQVGQTSGSIGKNFAGSVGDFADYQDKEGKGENSDGLLLKSGGQAISGVGQVINLAGIVSANGAVLRATGSFVNALGMVVSGVGELQPPGEKKNVAKAATNFVGAAFAALGGVGFAIEHDAVAKVLEEVARSFEAAGSASSAVTPFGGAADDAKNSKAAGATKRDRLLADPKPGGQAIAAIGGVMNTAALILNKIADGTENHAEAAKMKIAARVLGSVGSTIQSVGAGFTADGEWNPRKAPAREADPERGHEMANLDPVPA